MRRYYTPREDEYILSSGESFRVMAQRLNRSVSSVWSRKTHLNHGGPKRKPYSLEDDRMLAQSTKSIKELSDILGKSPTSVQHRIGLLRSMGVEVCNKQRYRKPLKERSDYRDPSQLSRRPYTVSEQKMLISSTLSIVELSKKLGRSYNSITTKLHELRMAGVVIVERDRKPYTRRV